MNIFYLDKDLNTCAQYHCDKHVVKMILEYSQILSTAHRVLDGTLTEEKVNNRKRKTWTLSNKLFDIALYKATHVNHPSNIWVRTNQHNYLYLFNLLCKLLNEYTIRYNKEHASGRLIIYLQNLPTNINMVDEFFEPPQCMPDECKVENDSVLAYRNYYKKYKVNFAKWKTTVPVWM
jgi:hypothetical protein